MLLKSLDKLKGANEDETTGIAIVKRALEEPLRQIVENAGIEGSIVVQKVKEGKGDFGFNARTEVYENLYKAGVIDPTKVTRIALENAASIAGMLLTTECVVADKPKKEEPPYASGWCSGHGWNGLLTPSPKGFENAILRSRLPGGIFISYFHAHRFIILFQEKKNK